MPSSTDEPMAIFLHYIVSFELTELPESLAAGQCLV